MKSNIDTLPGQLGLTTWANHEVALIVPGVGEKLQQIFMEIFGQSLVKGNQAQIFREHVCNRYQVGEQEFRTCPLLAAGICRGVDQKGVAQFTLFDALPAIKTGLGLFLMDRPELLEPVISPRTQRDVNFFARRVRERGVVIPGRDISDEQFEKMDQESPNCRNVMPFQEILNLAEIFEEENDDRARWK